MKNGWFPQSCGSSKLPFLLLQIRNCLRMCLIMKCYWEANQFFKLSSCCNGLRTWSLWDNFGFWEVIEVGHEYYSFSKCADSGSVIFAPAVSACFEEYGEPGFSNQCTSQNQAMDVHAGLILKRIDLVTWNIPVLANHCTLHTLVLIRSHLLVFVTLFLRLFIVFLQWKLIDALVQSENETESCSSKKIEKKKKAKEECT